MFVAMAHHEMRKHAVGPHQPTSLAHSSSFIATKYPEVGQFPAKLSHCKMNGKLMAPKVGKQRENLILPLSENTELRKFIYPHRITERHCQSPASL